MGRERFEGEVRVLCYKLMNGEGEGRSDIARGRREGNDGGRNIGREGGEVYQRGVETEIILSPRGFGPKHLELHHTARRGQNHLKPHVSSWINPVHFKCASYKFLH